MFFFLQYYESLLIEAKSKLESAIAEAVENAVTYKMQDIKSKLEKCIEDKNAMAEVSFLLHYYLLLSFFLCFGYGSVFLFCNMHLHIFFAT